MRYTDQEKNAVIVNGWTVPRGHRFWVEFGIDVAEAAGEIEGAPVTE